jgi:hypothetical protein
MVEGKSEVKRNRFLQIMGGRKEINTALVNKAKMRAGIKGYITNLNIPDSRSSTSTVSSSTSKSLSAWRSPI